MNSRLAALSLLAFAIPLALPAQRSDPIDDMRYRQHERRIADAERQRAETDRRLRQLEFEQERERWRNELRNRRWSGEDVSRATPLPRDPDLIFPLHPNPAIFRNLLLADIRLAEQLFPGTTDPETALGAQRVEIENELQKSNSPLAHPHNLTLVSSILAERELRETAAEKERAETLAASQERAERLYPFLHDPASPEFRRMREIEQHWRETGDPLLHSPEKPFILAALAAQSPPPEN